MFGIKEMLEAEFNRGVEHGKELQKSEQLNDANRRQEYLFDEGKRAGYEKGSVDGFAKGYKIGHADGVIEGKYGGIEEINLDDLVAEEPFTGTPGRGHSVLMYMSEGICVDCGKAFTKLRAADKMCRVPRRTPQGNVARKV